MSFKNLGKAKMKFSKMNINLDDLKKIDSNDMEIKKMSKRVEPYERTSYKTVKEFFSEACRKYPDRPCILEKVSHKEEYKEKVYKEFYKDVMGLGTALVSMLKLKGKRIVIIGETQYGWYVSYMAVLCGVGIAVPVDKDLPLNELENLIIRSKACAIIYSPKKRGDISKIEKNIPAVKFFIEMKSSNGQNGKNIGLDNLIELGRNIVESGNRDFENIVVDPEEFRILFFTSGTTSNAKGVMLNNRNLAENINAVTAYVKLYPEDRLFSVLPLHHCYESTIGFLYPVSRGASIAVCEGLRYIVPNLQEAKPTAILTVPLLVENLYKKINEKIVKNKKNKLVNAMISVTNLLKKAGIDVKRRVFREIYENLGGNLRIIVSAAAPIEKTVGVWLEGIGITFLQGYGLTETAPIAALTPEYDTHIGSAGKAIVQADIKILNPNDNGEGEILIKSPTLMIGYYEAEEETRKVIDEDGYFHSGDIGYIDEDGYLYLTGRSKNVIVTQNGKNIYPEEIEMLLEKYDEVREVMVYGKESNKHHSKDNMELIITARVVPNYDKIEEKYGKLTNEGIYDIIWNRIKEVNRKLTSYKAVKLLEIKEDAFEKTSTMKIKRYKEINNV